MAMSEDAKDADPSIGMKLFSAWFWFYLVASLTVFWFAVAIPWLLITPFDRRRRFSHWYAYTWANHLELMSLWRIQVEGGEHMREDTAYVLACNHQSSGDILTLFSLRKQFRWVAKRELFAVPFLGWMMAMAGYVGIKRGDPNSRKKMMAKCRRHLELGNSVAIFPEGTRSKSGDIQPFKIGAFVLACEADAPVLPVLMEGTREALPRASFVFGVDALIYPIVRVLEPLHPADYGNDPEQLRDATRAVMVRERAALRAEIEGRGGFCVPPPYVAERGGSGRRRGRS